MSNCNTIEKELDSIRTDIESNKTKYPSYDCFKHSFPNMTKWIENNGWTYNPKYDKIIHTPDIPEKELKNMTAILSAYFEIDEEYITEFGFDVWGLPQFKIETEDGIMDDIDGQPYNIISIGKEEDVNYAVSQAFFGNDTGMDRLFDLVNPKIIVRHSPFKYNPHAYLCIKHLQQSITIANQLGDCNIGNIFVEIIDNKHKFINDVIKEHGRAEFLARFENHKHEHKHGDYYFYLTD
jgi:hypothetical protein